MGASLILFGPLLFRCLATVWLLSVATVDLRTATIPNWMTLPAIVVLGAWRLIRPLGNAIYGRLGAQGHPVAGIDDRILPAPQALPGLAFMILAWAVCFALWELHIVGGGDAKTLMGIFALLPSAEFAVFLAVAVLLLSLPLLLLRWRGISSAVHSRLRQGRFGPTRRQLEEEGRPYAWTFCLPTVAYLWLVW